MSELLVPVLYVAIPAIILMLAFVAILRKEQQEIDLELKESSGKGSEWDRERRRKA